jgi:hypothetical protein
MDPFGSAGRLSRIIAALILMLGTTAFAADSLSHISGEFNPNKRKERVEIADDIIAQLKLLDSYLPNLRSPEMDWVHRERIAIEKLKGTDAYSTR